MYSSTDTALLFLRFEMDEVLPFDSMSTMNPSQDNLTIPQARRRRGTPRSEYKHSLRPEVLASPRLLSLSSTNRASIADITQRRKTQNRVSQRAFRERKKLHTDGLQAQITNLQGTHSDLLESYNKKADELTNLNTYVAKLHFEINNLQNPPAIDGFLSSDTLEVSKPDSGCSSQLSGGTYAETSFTTPLDWGDFSDIEELLGEYSSRTTSPLPMDVGGMSSWS
jgi:bZIP transcription factor